ncbi:MAG: Na+/H+ antiporter [Acidobacteriaceae bacterium]
MLNGWLQTLQLILLFLLLFVVVFATLARKLQVPFPIVLVLAGLMLSFVPGIPLIRLNPQVVFLIFLPPLLYSAAWLTSWREFRHNLVTILLLACGLVGFTVLGVSKAAGWFLGGFDWRVGFVLGAVVATTDAIAATSIAKRMHLPRRIVDVLEGESLLNDATGLLALEFGLSILVTGHTPTLASGLLRWIYLTVAGIVLGLLVGLLVEWFERWVDDGPIEITISLLVPYVAYLAAESIHASGVLAVVACGLYLSRQSAYFFSPSVRMQTYAVWNTLSFILNGLVFVLIGLQLPYVLGAIKGYSLHTLIEYGVIFSLLLIGLRMLWVFPSMQLAYRIRRHLLRRREPRPSLRATFVVGWTGMRGVIALAAAITLPEMLANGKPFPQRNLIVFLTFCVILVTLVLQGLSLPLLIRMLGLTEHGEKNCEEEDARRMMLTEAMDYLAHAQKKDEPQYAGIYEDMMRRYETQLTSALGQDRSGKKISPQHSQRLREVTRAVLAVERRTVVQLRNGGLINDEVLRLLEHDIDLRESRLQQLAKEG